MFRHERDYRNPLLITALFCFTAITGASSVTLEIAGSVSGRFATIQDAINAAPANATVRIAPGRYNENLVVTSPLTLAGPGWDKATVGLLSARTPGELKSFAAALQAGARSTTSPEVAAHRYYELMDRIYPPALVLKLAGDVTVKGLRFTLLPQHDAPLAKLRISEQLLAPLNTVWVTTTSLTMTDCAVVGCVTDGIVAGAGSVVNIERCLVAGVFGDGIGFVGSSTGSVINSDIRACYHYGIAIGPRTKDVLVDNCRISDTAWHGIRLDDCHAIIRDNRLYNHARCGLYVSGATTSELMNNIISECGSGISFYYNCRDAVHRNTFANCNTAIQLLRGADPEIANNLFLRNKAGVIREPVPGKVNESQLVKENQVWQTGVGAGQLEWSTGSLFIEPQLRSADAALELADDATTCGARRVAEPVSPFAIQTEESAMLPATASRSFRLWSPPYKTEIVGAGT